MPHLNGPRPNHSKSLVALLHKHYIYMLPQRIHQGIFIYCLHTYIYLEHSLQIRTQCLLTHQRGLFGTTPEACNLTCVHVLMGSLHSRTSYIFHTTKGPSIRIPLFHTWNTNDMSITIFFLGNELCICLGVLIISIYIQEI